MYFPSIILIHPYSADTVPIRTVNRQCSSGLQAVADVAAFIQAGYYDIGKREDIHQMHIVRLLSFYRRA